MVNFRIIPAAIMLVWLAAPSAVAQDTAPLRDIPVASMDGLNDQEKGLLRQAMNQFDAVRDQAQGPELGIAYGRVGLHYLAHRRLEPALAAFANAATLDSANYRWPYFAALALSFGGQGDAAIARFGQSLRLNPDNEAAATRLGLALIGAGKTASARSLLEPLVKAGGNAAALAGMGRLALEGGRHQEAADWYEQALAIQENADALHAPLAQAYEALGQSDKAATHSTQTGSRLPVVEDQLVALLAAHREPSSNFVARGDVARDRGQLTQAAVFYDFATAINPQDTVAKERLSALRTQTQNSTATTGEPVSASDFFERGVFFAASGDDANAASDFESALELDPDAVATRVFLANARMRQGQYADAAVQYGMAGARDEKNAELRFRQGIAWIAAQRCDRAETALLAGYELEERAVRIVQAIARLYATCDVDSAKRKTALAYAQLLYNAQPTLETAETLAMVLAANGEFEDAADFQRQAIFEGLKTGRAQSDPSLSENLELYVGGQQTRRAWPEGHPIFTPARPTPKG
ncbi:MAG: tetratricopeptide repeat protein [Gammaproteobacteria bacterium]